jgi:hypothetical protein
MEQQQHRDDHSGEGQIELRSFSIPVPGARGCQMQVSAFVVSLISARESNQPACHGAGRLRLRDGRCSRRDHFRPLLSSM